MTGLASSMRVGPIGPSPSSRRSLRRPAARALRSAPAQKTPFAPVSTATAACSSASKARNASASATRVGSSTAFRTSGRSMVTVVTGPSRSTRTRLMDDSVDGDSGCGSGLDHGDDQPDGGEDVADPDALRLGSDLHHRFARVVDLPGDLPALGLAARDGLLELFHDLLEGVALTVVQDGHPGWRDPGVLDLLDVRSGKRLLGHGSMLHRQLAFPERRMVLHGHQDLASERQHALAALVRAPRLDVHDAAIALS